MASEHIHGFLAARFEKDKTWKQVLEQARPDFRDWFDHLEFRTYLRQCVTKNAKRTKIVQRLLGLDYPKYVWVTEVSSSPLLNHAAKEQRQCLGYV